MASGREFKIALALAILLHALILGLSPFIEFWGMGRVEKDAYRLFRVNIVNIDPNRFSRVFASHDILNEALQRETERLAERELLFPPEWHPSDRLPIPGDIMPVDQQGLAERGVFSEREGIWHTPESDPFLDDQSKEFDRKVVEIAQSVGQEKPDQRWRRPPSTNKGMEPFGIGLGDGLPGSGKAGDQPAMPLGGKEVAPLGVESSRFSPTVPTGLITLDRSERGTPLSDSQVPIAVSPVGQRNLSRHEPIDQFLEARVETYHDPRGQRYFRILLLPNAKSSAMKVLPKDIIYVLDASGSIGRRVFQEMKTSVIQAIMRLPSTDRFNVLGFQSDVEFLWSELQEANDVNKALAAGFVQKLRPAGMTNIYRSLSSVGDLSRSSGRPFLISLFSDGRANIGVTNNREIINDLSRKTGNYVSIFSFGIGLRVNHYLLDLLSYRNKGRFDYAQEERYIERDIMMAQERIKSPVLLNLTADYGNVSSDDVYPKRLPDLFLNDAIIIYGLYDEQETCALRIVGETDTEKREFLFDIPLPRESTGPADIARYWALQRVYELIGQMSQTGDDPQRQREIDEISKQFGLQVPY